MKVEILSGLVVAGASMVAAGIVLTNDASVGHAAATASRPGLGVRQAKARGVPVSAAAASIMRAAPVGSCPNDPFQPKCRRPYPRYLYAASDLKHPPVWLAPYLHERRLQGIGPGGANYPCTASAYRLTQSGNQETGDGSFYCKNFIEMQAWERLDERWRSDGRWHVMAASRIATKLNWQGMPNTIIRGAYAPCTYTRVYNLWKAELYGFRAEPGGSEYYRSYRTAYGCMD